MKVIVAHNRYRDELPSGENVTVDEDISNLQAAGVEVVPFITSSDSISAGGARVMARAAAGPIFNPQTVRAIERIIDTSNADVLHLHNVYPLLSPAVVRTAQRLGLPTVQTVHNYRHVCAAGTLYRDGHDCRKCLGSTGPLPAVVHGCYRGSRLQSVPMATGLLAHRRTWRNVSRLLCVSHYQREQLQGVSYLGDRLHVKPNSVPDRGYTPSGGRSVLFVGRLSREKGVEELISAWRLSGADSGSHLTIAGDGPLRQAIDSSTADDPSISVVGRQSPDRIKDLMDRAALVVVPSMGHETFGRTVVEAFAAGRPVLATRTGALSELVDSSVGWLVKPCVEAIAQGLTAALRSHDLSTRGENSRARYVAHYTPEAVTRLLIEHYEAVTRR